MSGYYGVRSISDFICYKYPFLYVIDCKAHAGNTVSFKDFSQYEQMKEVMDIPGVFAGTVIWYYDHDRVIFVPIQTWKQLEDEEKKSFNIKMVGTYDCLELPSKKKRVFMDTDYTALLDYCRGKYGDTELRQ